jgi:hypothetical protein
MDRHDPTGCPCWLAASIEKPPEPWFLDVDQANWGQPHCTDYRRDRMLEQPTEEQAVMKPYQIGRVIRRAIDNARQGGLSLDRQNELAVRAVIQLDPDMTEEQALVAIRRVRELEKEESQSPE